MTVKICVLWHVWVLPSVKWHGSCDLLSSSAFLFCQRKCYLSAFILCKNAIETGNSDHDKDNFMMSDFWLGLLMTKMNTLEMMAGNVFN